MLIVDNHFRIIDGEKSIVERKDYIFLSAPMSVATTSLATILSITISLLDFSINVSIIFLYLILFSLKFHPYIASIDKNIIIPVNCATENSIGGGYFSVYIMGKNKIFPKLNL